MNEAFMKERPVLPLLASMALPMMISMLVNSLYNIVDSYFVAQISEDAMTALSLVFPLQNLINAVAIGFGVGISAVIALHLGAGNPEKAGAAATHGAVLSGLHGIVLAVGCIAVIPSFLGMFTQSEQVLAYGLEYARIVFSFAPIITFCLAYEKIFQAIGSMNTTMLCLMCGCVLNILLDPLLIFGYGPFPALGIAGAAIATAIGQTANLALYLVIFCLRRPASVWFAPSQLRPDREVDCQLYAIGIPAALNMALSSLLVSALNAILAVYGELYILVLGSYYKLQTFLYLPANGVIQGMRPLIGYNYGAREHRRVRQIYTLTLAMTGSIMLFGTIICLLCPGWLIGLFATSPAAIQAGQTALRIISAGFLISAVSVTSSGALEGIGKGLPSLCISLLRYVVLIIPAAFLFSRLWGPAGVWCAFGATEWLAAGASILICKRTVLRPAPVPETASTKEE